MSYLIRKIFLIFHFLSLLTSFLSLSLLLLLPFFLTHFVFHIQFLSFSTIVTHFFHSFLSLSLSLSLSLFFRSFLLTLSSIFILIFLYHYHSLLLFLPPTSIYLRFQIYLFHSLSVTYSLTLSLSFYIAYSWFLVCLFHSVSTIILCARFLQLFSPIVTQTLWVYTYTYVCAHLSRYWNTSRCLAFVFICECTGVYQRLLMTTHVYLRIPKPTNVYLYILTTTYVYKRLPAIVSLSCSVIQYCCKNISEIFV